MVDTTCDRRPDVRKQLSSVLGVGVLTVKELPNGLVTDTGMPLKKSWLDNDPLIYDRQHNMAVVVGGWHRGVVYPHVEARPIAQTQFVAAKPNAKRCKERLPEVAELRTICIARKKMGVYEKYDYTSQLNYKWIATGEGEPDEHEQRWLSTCCDAEVLKVVQRGCCDMITFNHIELTKS